LSVERTVRSVIKQPDLECRLALLFSDEINLIKLCHILSQLPDDVLSLQDKLTAHTSFSQLDKNTYGLCPFPAMDKFPNSLLFEYSDTWDLPSYQERKFLKYDLKTKQLTAMIAEKEDYSSLKEGASYKTFADFLTDRLVEKMVADSSVTELKPMRNKSIQLMRTETSALILPLVQKQLAVNKENDIPVRPRGLAVFRQR